MQHSYTRRKSRRNMQNFLKLIFEFSLFYLTTSDFKLKIHSVCSGCAYCCGIIFLKSCTCTLCGAVVVYRLNVSCPHTALVVFYCQMLWCIYNGKTGRMTLTCLQINMTGCKLIHIYRIELHRIPLIYLYSVVTITKLKDKCPS